VKPIVDKVKACLHDRFSHRRVLEVILKKYDKASKNVERNIFLTLTSQLLNLVETNAVWVGDVQVEVQSLQKYALA
jgi:hypothetical protein